MYAHACDMYNVQPKEGSASVGEIQLHVSLISNLANSEQT